MLKTKGYDNEYMNSNDEASIHKNDSIKWPFFNPWTKYQKQNLKA